MNQENITRKIRTYFGMNKMKTEKPKLWYAAKTVLRGKVIVVNTYIKI